MTDPDDPKKLKKVEGTPAYKSEIDKIRASYPKQTVTRIKDTDSYNMRSPGGGSVTMTRSPRTKSNNMSDKQGIADAVNKKTGKKKY